MKDFYCTFIALSVLFTMIIINQRSHREQISQLKTQLHNEITYSDNVTQHLVKGINDVKIDNEISYDLYINILGNIRSKYNELLEMSIQNHIEIELQRFDNKEKSKISKQDIRKYIKEYLENNDDLKWNWKLNSD